MILCPQSIMHDLWFISHRHFQLLGALLVFCLVGFFPHLDFGAPSLCEGTTRRFGLKVCG